MTILLTDNELSENTLLSGNIDKDKLVVLKEKSQMQTLLASSTRVGDLILFANDAPNFI